MSEPPLHLGAQGGARVAGRDQYNAGRDQYIGLSAAEAAALIQEATGSLERQAGAQRARIDDLQARLGTTEGILRRSVDILRAHLDRGEIPFEALPERLIELVGHRQGLLSRVRELPPDPMEAVAALDRELADALAAGDDARAETLARRKRDLRLDAAERHGAAIAELVEARTRSLADAADSEATLADLALGRLEYRAAARHFRAAGDVAPGGDAGRDLRLRYGLAAADALYRQGDEFADNDALAEAVDALRTVVLPLVSRISDPCEWATVHHALGNALRTLGERETGTAHLEDAVAAYRAALENRPRERAGLDWARTRHELGTALMRLGERESGTARLEEAIAAYEAALQECTRACAPLEWARMQSNLATALRGLAARDGSTDRLEQAIAAYRAALSACTRERAPLQWAKTQTNLATTLAALGARERGTARLEEAVAAYRAAQTERSRERVPLQWAMTQMNLGIALRVLGEREDGTARLEEAVATYRATLTECTRERVPLQWAMVQTNLGTALWALGERAGSREWRREAVVAYRAAVEIFEAAGASHYHRIAARNLEAAEADLGGPATAPAADASLER
jgi:tetratricopeptide (TPR) repeat protein